MQDIQITPPLLFYIAVTCVPFFFWLPKNRALDEAFGYTVVYGSMIGAYLTILRLLWAVLQDVFPFL